MFGGVRRISGCPHSGNAIWFERGYMFVTIESKRPTQMPAWAVLERQLIRAIDEAAPVFLEKYTRPGGELI